MVVALGSIVLIGIGSIWAYVAVNSATGCLVYSLLFTGGLIFGNLLIGLLMDFVRNDYRVACLWTAVFSAAALVPMILVIRGWRQHGGADHYVAPLP